MEIKAELQYKRQDGKITGKLSFIKGTDESPELKDFPRYFDNKYHEIYNKDGAVYADGVYFKDLDESLVAVAMKNEDNIDANITDEDDLCNCMECQNNRRLQQQNIDSDIINRIKKLHKKLHERYTEINDVEKLKNFSTLPNFYNIPVMVQRIMLISLISICTKENLEINDVITKEDFLDIMDNNPQLVSLYKRMKEKLSKLKLSDSEQDIRLTNFINKLTSFDDISDNEDFKGINIDNFFVGNKKNVHSVDSGDDITDEQVCENTNINMDELLAMKAAEINAINYLVKLIKHKKNIVVKINAGDWEFGSFKNLVSLHEIVFDAYEKLPFNTGKAPSIANIDLIAIPKGENQDKFIDKYVEKNYNEKDEKIEKFSVEKFVDILTDETFQFSKDSSQLSIKSLSTVDFYKGLNLFLSVTDKKFVIEKAVFGFIIKIVE